MLSLKPSKAHHEPMLAILCSCMSQQPPQMGLTLSQAAQRLPHTLQDQHSYCQAVTPDKAKLQPPSASIHSPAASPPDSPHTASIIGKKMGVKMRSEAAALQGTCPAIVWNLWQFPAQDRADALKQHGV